VQLGIERNLGDETLAALYRANFAESRSIFDVGSLAEIAGEVGLDTAEARAILESSAYADQVREDEAVAARLGIQGVPFFVLDRAYGISGAQPIETLTTVLDQVWAEVHAGGPA